MVHGRLQHFWKYFLLAALCAPSVADCGAAEFPPVAAVPLKVPLYLEGRLRGMVQMLIMPDTRESYVEAGPLLVALRPVLAPEKVKAIEAEVTHGFLLLKQGAAGGVAMRFDEVLVAVVTTIPSENRKQQALHARQQFDPSTRTITLPSALSAYLNIRGSQDYVEHAFDPQQEGRRPARISTDGAVNLNGWVLEGNADYAEQDPVRLWARGNVRVIHDLPDAAIRMAIGDLSYPIEGLQSFQPMLGMTVARNFDLQPYRITEPTGQTSFVLKSPSRVDVLVNGQKVRTLQLEPGPYSIRDFPVVSGSNDVTLIITDATGRTEIKKLEVVSDINLLAAGLHKYSYSAGVMSRTDARRIMYDTGLPVLSAFHRYGLTDEFTLGANLQANREQQMGGLDVTVGQPWAAVRADMAASRIPDAGSGFAWRLQLRNADNARIREDGSFKGTRSFSLLASYQDRKFAPLGNLQPDNAASYEIAARLGWQWSPTLSIGVNAGNRWYRDDRPDDWSAGISFSERLTGGFQAGLNLGTRQAQGFGIFLTLTWAEHSTRHSFSGSYDSVTRTTRADWNYAQESRSDSFSASSSVVRAPDRTGAAGNITYFGSRGEISARHDLLTTHRSGDGAMDTSESRSQLRFGTALVASDGQMAFSRPVSNSFALFVPDPAISKYPIGINPRGRTGEGAIYDAKVEGTNPAVIPDLTPYFYRTFRIDASRLPPGFDAGESNYTVYPGYRSGTVIRLGSDSNVMLDGTLVFRDGTPVALLAGSVRPVADPDALPVAFFTNRAGRFRIDKMKPGRYAITLFRYPDATSFVEIPDGAAGPTPVGDLVLPVVPER